MILLTKNEKDEKVFIDTSKQYVYRATKKSFAKMGYKDIVYAMSIEWKLAGKHSVSDENESSAGPSSSVGPSKSSTYKPFDFFWFDALWMYLDQITLPELLNTLIYYT